ncbi:MAG: LacI family DNA-binding transcriptional regulator [Magnetovibrionaceae bacterium]
MPRPTVRDVADEAGVSLATVDRVLNARPGVRAQTVSRVQKAISKLGYVRDTYAANLARQRDYKFAFLLPKGPSQFVETLKDALAEAIVAQAADRISVQVYSIPLNDPHAVVRELRALQSQPFDGVGIMSTETPEVRDAVRRLKAAGVPVVAVVSDLPSAQRDYFVGIKSISAGRTAGLLIGRFARVSEGQVLVVTPSTLSHDSLERRLGFDAVIANEFTGLQVLPTIETHADPDRTRAVIARAARTYSNIVGIYSMGSGNAPLLDALRENNLLSGRPVIAHELTPLTREALLNGELDAVITQNIGHLVRSALRVLRAKSDHAAIYEDQERIRIDIVTRENLP